MMNNQGNRQSYYEASQNLLYSLIIIFPMLFIYELLGFINNFDSTYQIRNGADAMIRQAFLIFGPNSQLLYGFTLFLIFFSVCYRHRETLLNDQVNLRYLVMMIGESLVWCSGLLITMKGFSSFFIASPMTSDLLEQFYLSIGAGIWEELIFRLGLISLLAYIIKLIFRYGKPLSVFLSLLISGILFSLFHYIGIYGDVFTWQTFTLRAFAGVFLGVVFLFRGLGISVYTHIFYDMVLVSLPVIGLTS